MKIGDKVYEIGNSGTLIVEETISDIYIVNGVTIYDTKRQNGANGISFDDRAIEQSVFLTKKRAEERAAEIQASLERRT